jgi:hypothetical protein
MRSPRDRIASTLWTMMSCACVRCDSNEGAAADLDIGDLGLGGTNGVRGRIVDELLLCEGHVLRTAYGSVRTIS